MEKLLEVASRRRKRALVIMDRRAEQPVTDKTQRIDDASLKIMMNEKRKNVVDHRKKTRLEKCPKIQRG